MSRVKLKVCGITSYEDARAAIDCGADYLGFNFFPPSPRYLSPGAARLIVERLPPGVVTVGIFVNEPRPKQVRDILGWAGIQIAQLHGDERPSYCAEFPTERVIKALRVSEQFDPQTVLQFPVSAVLLDNRDAKLYGGTGRTVNWVMAREAARLTKVFLAGGLSPENIAEAIRIVGPFAVDVNSGVESAPGRKDAAKLRRLRQEMDLLAVKAENRR